MKIPFLDLEKVHYGIDADLKLAFSNVLKSNSFILGKKLEMFEQEFAEYCEVKHCIGVSNGLDALQLILRGYGIGEGCEVIVPSNTFIATWLAVSQTGAIPVAADPDEVTHNINPQKIESLVTSRTAAIIPVHLYGQPADMDPINAIAAKYGLLVIEDAAQAQGARYKGKRTGGLGHSAATSFYPGKNLGCLGDGGAILTSDASLARKVRQLRNYGSNVKYHHELLGYNSRLDELQASILTVKLKHLDYWNASRAHIAKQYSEGLKETGLILPIVPDFADPAWHLYVVRAERRDELQNHLSMKEISTVIHYPIPPHRQNCYNSSDFGDLPISEKLAREVLSLPIYPGIQENDIHYIIKSIKEMR